ncbi:hypothetical protein Emed_006208 [Eimeria media]
MQNKQFAEKGENLEIEVEGYPSLVAHAAAHSEAILRLLLEEFHCDPNLRSVGRSHQTPLFEARGKCLKFLLSFGADPTALDENGHSALTYLIEEQKFDQAAELLLAGVAPWVSRDSRGQSCMQLALASLSTTAEKQQSFWNAFFEASCEADPEAAKELLRCADSEGLTCIQRATAAGCEALAARMTQLLQGSPRDAAAVEAPAETEEQKTGEALEAKEEESPQPDNLQGVTTTLEVQGEMPAEAKEVEGSHMLNKHDQTAEATQEAAEDKNLIENHLEREGEKGEEVPNAEKDESLPHTKEVPNETGDAPAVEVEATLKREEEDEVTSALMSELKQLKLRASEIEEEFEAAERALEDAEEANAKVVSRVASFLGNQPRYDLRRMHGQHSMSAHHEDQDEQPPVTTEGYERALLQTEQLDVQLTAVKRQLQQILENKTQQENLRGAKVLECRQAFAEFVLQVAKNSFMRHGGKPVSEQQVKKLLQLGEEKQQSINSLRRELLMFQYHQELQQAQSFDKAQWEDEQYTPLEAMDFEQLKMENQTLNERLVERQEEARKLQAIMRNSVQLAALDAELAQQREVAAQLKRERAECRQQNERIKCQTDVINSELLAADWEATQEKLRETDYQVKTPLNH